jgi:hypothetical protein
MICENTFQLFMFAFDMSRIKLQKNLLSNYCLKSPGVGKNVPDGPKLKSFFQIVSLAGMENGKLISILHVRLPLKGSPFIFLPSNQSARINFSSLFMLKQTLLGS